MSDLTTVPTGMSPEELDRSFHEGDAERIVALARATPDEHVSRLLEDDAVRAAAVGSELARTSYPLRAVTTPPPTSRSAAGCCTSSGW